MDGAYQIENGQLSSKVSFAPGDVLFGKLRPYLIKSWLATFAGTCSSEIWVLRAAREICEPRFLHQLTLSTKFASATHASSGSKMPRADWDFVSEYPFLVPPLAEQRKIADILDSCYCAAERLDLLLSSKVRRKRGLMQ